MENKLIAYFSGFTTFKEDELKILTDSIVTRTYKKGDVLVKEGQRNTNSLMDIIYIHLYFL